MNSGPFETVNISLPAELVALLRDAAAREDRTPSGQIRHLVAQTVRQAPPPPPQRKVLQNVEWTPAGIAAAKARVAKLKQRHDALLARSRQPLYEPTPATDDDEIRRLSVELEFTERQVALAERMVAR